MDYAPDCHYTLLSQGQWVFSFKSQSVKMDIIEGNVGLEANLTDNNLYELNAAVVKVSKQKALEYLGRQKDFAGFQFLRQIEGEC